MKKIILLSFAFFILLALTGTALFLKQFPDKELATISASVGNPDDCDMGGSPKVKAVGTVAWMYFNLPGISQSYIDAGNSFLSSAFEALICKQDQPGYPENLRRVKRLVLHAKQNGEAIDQLGANGFSLLHGSVIKSDISLARFLLKQGADISAATANDAVWYAKSYDKKTAYQLALALRENDWPVSDEMVALLK